MRIYKEINREEFKDMINWELWDKLVKKTREDIDEILKNSYPPKAQTKKYKCYAYNNEGELAYLWDTQREMYYHFPDACTSTLCNYVNHDYIFNNLMLSRYEYPKEIAHQKYRHALEHGKVYQGINNRSRKKPVYSYNEVGKMIGLYESCYIWARKNGLQYYSSQFKQGDIILNDILSSNNFYDEATAKEKYQEIKKCKK